MGDYLRKCEKSVLEMAAVAATEAVEVGNIGGGGIIKMRATEEEKEIISSSKRRKVDDSEAPELLLNLPANSSVSGSTANSTSTSSASDSEKEKMRSIDLEYTDSETEISSTFKIIQFSRETSPSSAVCGGDSGREFMEAVSSTTTKNKKSPPTSSREVKTSMPSAAEIEEFFAVAEKEEQKRFAEKYNYDTVKDMPLEGRYEWIQLKP